MPNFWKQLKSFRQAQGEPFFVLAPMADVTDLPFRTIVADCGRPDVFYTQFVSCDGLCSVGKERLLKYLAYDTSERPIVIQLFGSKPDNFYRCAQLAVELGFDGIDINMGCPERKVVKQGAGIALCRNPMLAKEIIAATQAGAGTIPVSVKTRLGLDAIDLKGWIAPLLETKIAALTIHGRTMKEMSKVPTHWDAIGQAADMAQGSGILIVGNGDVMSWEDGLNKAAHYNLDGIMVGRGIFHNPWFFNASNHQATIRERLDLLLKHTRLFEEFWGKQKNFDNLKRFYKIYISGWDGAHDLRAELMATKKADQVVDIISGYIKESSL